MTTFGISQDAYLRRMVEANQILVVAMQQVRDEANRYEDLSSKRIHTIAQEAIERVTKL